MAEQQRALERETGDFVEVLENEAEVTIDRIQDVGSIVKDELERKASVLGDVLQFETDVGVHAIQDAEDKALQNIKGLNEDEQTSFKSGGHGSPVSDHRGENGINVRQRGQTRYANVTDRYCRACRARILTCQKICHGSHGVDEKRSRS
ncbi:uncharacterized protein LOC128205899 isoform X3 [Mya arenaria]|uniref:uncharacterized protein LOC128205899 isoform X3 n=1 Tax=Mya arenaria TaxID=6604 RepID=UPI0022E1BCFB|nr:uncharacterized protein LOC128205899 isoform X3 [Mya arenaria]